MSRGTISEHNILNTHKWNQHREYTEQHWHVFYYDSQYVDVHSGDFITSNLKSLNLH